RVYFGTKVYSSHPKHGANFTFLLYDAATAAPLAQFEADYLGQIRTGAASGLAASLLAPDRPVKLALIGSGFQARSQLEAIRAVRPVTETRVWSRSEQKRERFAAETGSRAVNSSEEACAGADVIVTATYAKDPVIPAEAVPEGALVLAMGSNIATRREIPAELVRRARVIV